MADLNPASSTLSANFAPYVYDMLSRGQGLASLPFQEYTGQRFAGPSELQTQGFQGIAGLASGFGAKPVESYMSPYIQNVLNAQMDEARRQSAISGQQEQAKFAQAGAFGGARQQIAASERDRNLQQQLGNIQATGLQSAFDQASRQRLQEGQLGLQGLQSLMSAGETQRQIAQQPLDFGYQQFQESLQDPYKKTTFMQSLLQGMPLKAPEYNAGQSGLMSALQGGLSGLALYKSLFGG